MSTVIITWTHEGMNLQVLVTYLTVILLADDLSRDNAGPSEEHQLEKCWWQNADRKIVYCYNKTLSFFSTSHLNITHLASDLKWHHNQGLWSPLIQIMVCCLVVIAPWHGLNQFNWSSVKSMGSHFKAIQQMCPMILIAWNWLNFANLGPLRQWHTHTLQHDTRMKPTHQG